MSHSMNHHGDPSRYARLEGSSSIAEAFRETFNAPGQGDLGRNLYWADGHKLAMESIEQMEARLNG